MKHYSLIACLLFCFSLVAPMALAQDVIDPDEEEEPVYLVVDQMPQFPGGHQALFDFISTNVIYPTVARENGIEGKTIVQFIVEKDGSITHIQVVRTAGDPSLDKEAIRVVRAMPKWIPGKHRGELLRVKYTVPFNFRLTAPEPEKKNEKHQ